MHDCERLRQFGIEIETYIDYIDWTEAGNGIIFFLQKIIIK